MTPRTVDQVLDATASYIERVGWVQRESRVGKRVCIRQGLVDTTRDCDELWRPSYEHVYRELGMAPSVWNDKHCKSKREAVAKLREIASELRAGS